jgi:hypothetical protein
MGLFREIAMPLVARRIPVVPLRPKTKTAFMQDWEKLATTDPAKVEEWDATDPDANAGCVAYAQPDGVWFLEIDRNGYSKQIENETGQKIPDTFAVRSSPGRGHFYFRQTPASISMGNTQAGDKDGELWSARVDRRYVVGPGSYHPSGGRYEVLRDTDLLPAPDWLVQWCSQQKSTKISDFVDEGPITEGHRNDGLASILGRARQMLGMDREQLYQYGLSVNQRRCQPPMSDDEVRTIADSIGRYPVTENTPGGGHQVLLGGVALAPPPQAAQNLIEIPDIKPVAYPMFPRWVMKGTSIYDGLIEPVCSKNSRYPEFMFMPAVTIMLNYLALKVRVEYKNLIPSTYLALIGRKGRVIKSSSVNDVVEYLHFAGIVDNASTSTKNAEGKSLVFTVGSTEGLGLEMAKTNCKNAILLYDELATLTKKAAIDGSSVLPHLLTIHESKQFANVIKNRRESFSFEPGSYCVSLIACTTDKNFSKQWSCMAGDSSGMDDRFFFLYQPETLVPLKPYYHVDTKDAALVTRKRIDKAVLQAVYSIVDSTPLEQKMGQLGVRGESRAEKLALYFAVDLGKDEIDESCIERAIAICEYEIAAKKYLRVSEATTREGMIQNEIIQALQRNAGRLAVRDLNRIMHPERHGTTLWFQVYAGLVRNGWIMEAGTGVKDDPRMVILMRVPESDED